MDKIISVIKAIFCAANISCCEKREKNGVQWDYAFRELAPFELWIESLSHHLVVSLDHLGN